MDDVIARIVEIERQCSEDIGQARLEYGKKIEAHKHALEEAKTRESARIISGENSRLTQAVKDAKERTEAGKASALQESETKLSDPALKEAIKKDIISILLAG